MRRRHLLAAIVAAVLAAGTMVTLTAHGDGRGWIVPNSPALPAPTGEYPVGVRDVRMEDLTRPEPLGATDAARELMVSVYYPTAGTDGLELETYSLNPYLPEEMALERVEWSSRDLGLRDDAINWMFRTHARGYSPVRPGHYPVLVYSPTLLGSRWEYTSMAEELASHGYVVITVDHTYESPLVQFPADRQVRGVVDDASGRRAELDAIRADDLTFVINHLDQLGADIAAISDTSRTGLYGQTEAAHLDRPAEDATFDAIAPLPPPATEVPISGTTAQTFTDAAAYLPQLATWHPELRAEVARTLGTADPDDMTAETRRYLVSFFDQQLSRENRSERR